MIKLSGFAIVSVEGSIADRHHLMPPSLRHDCDFHRFQMALDRHDITLLGKSTHLAAPNAKKRVRLVVSGQDRRDEPDGNLYWWNPAMIGLADRVTELPGVNRDMAVVGGLGVFDLILSRYHYDAFELTVAHDARLDQGVPLFGGIGHYQDAIDRLVDHGLRLAGDSWLADRVQLFEFIRDPTAA